jgi:DNA-binding SARP family transcriptional activator
MRRGLAWLTGGLGVAGLVVYRKLHRVRAPEPAVEPAEELRQKLDEARAREEPEPAPALTDDLETRRREVHERGRAAVEEMRGGSEER